MSETNLLYTDVEDSVREAVRDALGDHVTPDAVSAMYDGNDEVALKTWEVLGRELGLAGLLVPESQGGAGGSARDAAVVLEELGRYAAPGPFLTSAVIAATVLVACRDKASVEGLASGEHAAAVAVPFSTMPGLPFSPTFKATGKLVSGAATTVAGAIEADLLVIPVEGAAGVELWAVQASDAEVTPFSSLDMSRQLADVVVVEALGVLLAGPDRAAELLDHALLLGAALLASEQVGIAQWCLDETVAYLKIRRQFGRVVGGFQGIKHRLADLFCEVEGARAAARYAAACADTGEDLAVAASVAQAYCSDVAVRAAEECVQLHGGIGMTWEHPAHLHLKRAKADQVALGTPGHHRHRLGELVDLPAR
ncbi:acyl-CoA dehydrogenase family protein [Nocardioides sp. Soil796]|uniref:acyl-CoA dehydrogenase family protein n=1 Tax=Nocardioides sp. Soil796 TaxID=1736412 RepID=UPI00070BC73B|nr:acyl-CoA dehydrogenase family protein [Nocardioides sp. Soil796]KRF10378.1 acyl-CoA dehydrogenase [Nocardioides sp. Soil796]